MVRASNRAVVRRAVAVLRVTKASSEYPRARNEIASANPNRPAPMMEMPGFFLVRRFLVGIRGVWFRPEFVPQLLWID
jgi:hypothetical protein